MASRGDVRGHHRGLAPGALLEALTQATIDGATRDRELPERQRTTLH
jgi:hypothetical protein